MAMSRPPFSNSMVPDGEPEDEPEADAEGRGDDHRPIQDNGTLNRGFSAGGIERPTQVNYALPPDPHEPHALTGSGGSSDTIAAYGIAKDEVKQDGENPSVQDYGFSGKAGKGETDASDKQD